MNLILSTGILNTCQLHQDFPSSLPFKHYPYSMMFLNSWWKALPETRRILSELVFVLQSQSPVGQFDGALESFQLERIDEPVGPDPLDEPVLPFEVGQQLEKDHSFQIFDRFEQL